MKVESGDKNQDKSNTPVVHPAGKFITHLTLFVNIVVSG